MQPLQDFRVLDFCEWLRKEKKEVFVFRDMELLQKCAQEYLDIKRNNREKEIRLLLHRIVDMVEFDEIFISYMRKHSQYCREHSDCQKCHMISPILHMCAKESIKRYDREICHTCEAIANSYDYGEISPYRLAKVAYELNMVDSDIVPEFKEDYPKTLDFIVQCNNELELEIDFLDWIARSGNGVFLNSKSYSLYEEILDEFISTLDRESEKQREKCKKQLLKLHSQYKNKSILRDRLLRVLSLEKRNEKRNNISYLIKRYCSDIYKCVLFLRESTKVENQKLYINSWDDLNALSADHLDIYYSPDMVKSSGYEISNCLRYLPESLKSQAPIIIIWKDYLENAKGIRIDGLNNEDIVSVIECIVGSIIEKKQLTQIVKEADDKVKSIKEGYRAIMQKNTYINFSDGSSNNGIISTGDEAKITQSVSNEITNESIDFEAVKKVIAEFTDVEKKQRDDLISILCRIETAVQNNDKEKQEEEKKSFKNVINSIGKCAFKLLATMDSVAGILSFLNLSIS